MSRYPYTIACDAIRVSVYSEDDWAHRGTSISRADASRIRQFIAAAIGMDDEELARKIADYANAQEPVA